MTTCDGRAERRGEAGVTLVEVLTAIVILIFGLMPVTNPPLTAASPNTVANQSPAAATSASRIMDSLRDTSFQNLLPGASVTADTGVVGPCGGAGAVAVNDPSTLNNCNDDVPGVGRGPTPGALAVTPHPAQ